MLVVYDNKNNLTKKKIFPSKRCYSYNGVQDDARCFFLIYSVYQNEGNPFSRAHCSKVN